MFWAIEHQRIEMGNFINGDSGAGMASGSSFAEIFAAIAGFDFGNRLLCFSRPTLIVGRMNLGDGHASWDNGFGYSYFNATTGFEFSAVSCMTYNFTNPNTDYQNGIDWHVDLEAFRFLTKQFTSRGR
jgi:hypothetical protein